MLMDEDLLFAQVSPLPMKNYFHPILDMDGEDDAQRIIERDIGGSKV